MKKQISMLLAAVTALSLLGGCGEKKETVQNMNTGEYIADANLNAPGEFPICKEKIKLTVGVPKSPNVSDYDNNVYTKLIEEKANVDLEFVYFPASQEDARKKLDLMVSAGGSELPDILVGFDIGEGNLYNYGSGNMIWDLTPYYENSAYYINQMFEDYTEENLKVGLYAADGKIYGVPRVSVNHAGRVYAYFWMYEPWLEKLGLEEPTTTEELKAVLKAFKEQDPNGNGIDDEIPFMGATNDMANTYLSLFGSSFLPVNVSTYYFFADENQKVHAAYIEDEWKDMLKYMNELCEEGLFSASSFTTNFEQFNQIARNSETLIGAMSCAPYIFETGDPRQLGYKVIGPIAGPEGVKWVTGTNEGRSAAAGAFVVTKNCQYPEAAFRIGDFMCSEEATLVATVGEEGVDWEKATEGTTGYEEMGITVSRKALRDLPEVHAQNWGTRIYAGYQPARMSHGQAQKENKEPSWSDEVISNIPNYLEAKYPYNLHFGTYLEEDVKRADELKYATSEYVNEMIAKFIVGRADIDAEWENYKKTLDDLGVQELIEIQQRAHDNGLKIEAEMANK